MIHNVSLLNIFKYWLQAALEICQGISFWIHCRNIWNYCIFSSSS